MKHLFILLILSIVLFSCSDKEKEGNDNTLNIENDFTQQFAQLTLKFAVADTGLDKNIGKEKPLKIFGKKYFPDTLIYKYFEKGSKINYYPIGKTQNEDQEIYIVMKAISGNRKAAYVLVYDNQLNYKDGAMICQTDGDNKTTYLATIDKYFNIMIRRTDFVQGGEPNLTEVYLGYNNSGKFGALVTNDTDQEVALQNPIDTLPQTKKFTGDYYLDSKNLISLRDAKDSGELVFFYHYEKDKTDCSGEIKEKIKMTGNNTAVFMKDGDPCVMNVIFENNKLTLTEESGCGNKKNSLNCSLNGTFIKAAKKISKPSTTTTTTVTPLGAKPATTVKTATLPAATAKPGDKKPVKPVAKPSVSPTNTKKIPLKQPDIQ